MLRASLAVVSFIASIAAGLPARADWQYAKWGMTPAEVLAASAGKASTFTSQVTGKIAVKLKAPHNAGDYEFQALFGFDAGTDKLSSVQLILLGASKCDALRDELIVKYGSPVRVTSSSLSKDAIWLDKGDNNRVAINNIGPGTVCSLEYSSLSSSSHQGL
ncbi:MAG: hypothetical protein JWR80_476 [Bradyrhizobium sp.]|nr:hypothetical protein [Bradyrhizobium sp.]